jgi:hypothetical protein
MDIKGKMENSDSINPATETQKISPALLPVVSVTLRPTPSGLSRKRGSAAGFSPFKFELTTGISISDEDMSKLYQIKKARRIPITELVATAVKEFIAQTEQQAVFSKAEKL